MSGFITDFALAAGLIKFGILGSGDDEMTIFDLVGAARGMELKTKSNRDARIDDAALAAHILFVQKGAGRRIQSPVAEFLRLEDLDRDVDHYVVSEDGRNWITFGDWRKKNGT